MKDTKVKTLVSEDLVNHVQDRCQSMAQTLGVMQDEVWQYFLRRYLGAVSASVARSSFSQEEWQEAYDEFNASTHSKLVTA